ncbi:MAG: hypothetical protein WCR20_07995, partial [Verrucomicrobiota bacterium]
TANNSSCKSADCPDSRQAQSPPKPGAQRVFMRRMAEVLGAAGGGVQDFPMVDLDRSGRPFLLASYELPVDPHFWS